MKPGQRARSIVILCGGIFAVAGAAFLLYPGLVELVELNPATPAARSDVRAVFGGLELGLGGFLIACATRARWLRAGVAASIAGFGGLLLGRVVGWATDGFAGTLSLVLALSEAVGLGLALFAGVEVFADRERAGDRTDAPGAAPRAPGPPRDGPVA